MEKTYLLDDEGLKHFIINGYVKVKTDSPVSFHQRIYQQIEEMFEKGGNLGNNVLPKVPDIQQVFSHPVVHGVLTSILGPNYVMHPHRYCHFNSPGSSGQNFHKDSYEGDEQVRHHRSRWAMGFYYPQDVTEDMGPTAVLPGTQYYETQTSAHAHTELPLCGEAGTVTIVHYDLWHRAMPNRSNKKRYMLKFLFTRLEEPTQPSWASEDARWRPIDEGPSSDTHQAVWKGLWDWFHGAHNGTIEDAEASRANGIPTLIEALRGKDEVVSLDAAYALGAIGGPAVPALIEALQAESEDIRRHAAYAVGAIGAPAVPALIEALCDASWWVRANAAQTLGYIGQPAKEAVPALSHALRDGSEWVRRYAAEALGTIGQPAKETVLGLIELLGDAHDWIRNNAVYALAKMGPAAKAAVPALTATLNDKNRYVCFHAIVALKQIATLEAKDALFDFLLTSRWCPLTTTENPY